MKIYYYIPYLLRLEKQRGLFKNINLYDIDPMIKRQVAEFLNKLSHNGDTAKGVPPLVYFLSLLTIVAVKNNNLWRKILRYSLLLAQQVDNWPKVLQKYYGTVEYDLKDFMKRAAKHTYTIPLYMLNIEGGKIKPNRYLLLNQLAWDIDSYMRSLERKLDYQVKKELQEIYRVSISDKRPRRTSNFYERILAASGIQDGKKRIIYYWLAPYLITIRGLTKDEALELLEEWLSRQEGSRVPTYWIRAELESVARRDIRPWRKEKVLQRDKQLEEILTQHKLI